MEQQPTSPQIVTLFGGARVSDDSQLYADSLLLGRLLADEGYAVATGGYMGTMEAALKGALEAGGKTIGYTCVTFDDKLEPNPWVREERKCATLPDRIQRMAIESAAFIIVHGGLGTLAELTVVWNMMLIAEIPVRPLIIVGPEWPQVVYSTYNWTQLGSSALALLTFTDTPQDAIDVLTRNSSAEQDA
ncbi:MAG: LOG family protein [Chloroflexota bacterium]|nr:LOG family protein [Chloroflexota bacterium]